jgi:hypothetical protein
VNLKVAETLLGPARKAVAALGEELGRQIEIRARPGQHQEQFEVTALDQGPPVSLELAWLTERPKKKGPRGGKDELAAAEPEPTVEAEEPLAAEPEPAAEAEEPPSAEPEPATEAEEPPMAAPEAEVEGPEPRAAEASEPAAPIGAAPVVLTPAGGERGQMPEMLDADGEKPILRRSEEPEES